MPRPRSESPDLEQLIVDALRTAGGSMQRTNLRNVIRPVVRSADFDQAIAGLLDSGKIVAERPTLYWKSPRGFDLPYRATIYRLPKTRKRKG